MNLDLTTVEDWIAHDPDVSTREELTAILRAAREGNTLAEADLADRFQGTLQFGTAGLRGKWALALSA
ncbi:hypothetical protein [Arcanobacterium hippocoleae]|uniref:hypothetical protein n=1 Tax=Arcanobacterium hippocoleae TaxID=149017 RepID=UPI0033429532